VVGKVVGVSESGFLETDDARIYYEMEGEGHPMVLIHAGVANLRMWDDQVSALSPRYRVIRYDTRGYGQTVTEDVEFSNRGDLAALLDHLEVPSAYVLGASRGGTIALDFTLEFPNRVDALIFVAGGVGGFETETDPSTIAQFQEAERRWEARDWDWLTAFETSYWVDGPGQAPHRVDPGIRSRVEDWIGSNYRAEKAEGRPLPLIPSAAGRFDQIRVPTLVVVGDLDDADTRQSCEHLATTVESARLEVFEGAAHMLNLEQPERFNRVLLQFLGNVETPKDRRLNQ
jgi:pimeloyl-ACP methyl ester carboxylesterase